MHWMRRVHIIRKVARQITWNIRAICPVHSMISQDMAELQFSYSKSDFVWKTPRWDEGASKAKFDEELMSRWDDAVKNGCFRYVLDDLKTKIIPGNMKYIAQLNLKRAMDRRKPQEMLSLAQPYNPNKFNFTKIKDGEILLQLCSNNRDSNHINDKTQNSSIGEENAVKKQKKCDKKHIVIINVSPLEYCNVLLVPDVQGALSQVLTKEAIQLAVEMLLLSSKRSFRVCWNSLGGFASVNHLHFHAYYLHQEMTIETAPSKHIHGPCHELIDWPARGFIFQLEENKDVDRLASSVFTVSNHLHSNEIAHNLFLTRGAPLSSQTSSTMGSLETVRAILWPRKSCFGAKTDEVFNVAVCELAGHLPIYNTEGFNKLTEEWAVDHVNEVSLSQQEFDSLKDDIKRLLI